MKKERLMQGVRATFRPEFLNRIDDVVCFEILSKEQLHQILEILVNFIWISFSTFLLYAGILLCKSMIARNVLSSGMRIPLVFIYSCLPISSLIVLIRLINDTINLIKRKE